MSENAAKTTSAIPAAPGGAPSVDDAVALSTEVMRATTSGKAAEATLAWVAKRLAEHVAAAAGEGAKPDPNSVVPLLLKLQRPEGRLKCVRIGDQDLKESEQFSIDRVGFGATQGGLHATVHRATEDQYVAAYRTAKQEEKTIVVAPVNDTIGPWGALAVALAQDSKCTDAGVRLLRIGSASLTKWLQAKENRRVVLEETPRAVLSKEKFLEHVDFLLSCRVKSGPNVGMIAVTFPGPKSFGASKTTARNLRVAIEQTRYTDSGTVLDDDTFILALAQCGMDGLRTVSSRIRAALIKKDPKAANCGFGLLCSDSGAMSATELIERAVQAAKKPARPSA